MNTSLKHTNATEEELAASEEALEEEEQLEEEEAHIHLPNPSLWPLFLGGSILLVFVGLAMLGTGNAIYDPVSALAPWFIFIGLPCVLISIMGWALQNPHGSVAHGARKGDRYAASFADAVVTGKTTVLAEQVLDQAQAVLDQKVTISSTAWSAHPVKVFVEREGVVLSLYGKVELEAQKKEIETSLRQVPGVLDVMNFLVAEDELLNAVNVAIESLRASGKLEGASEISVLVENGIVSLYGKVPDNAMKYLLEREISGIPGARVVINHIGLNKDIPGNLGKTTNRIARI